MWNLKSILFSCFVVCFPPKTNVMIKIPVVFPLYMHCTALSLSLGSHYESKKDKSFASSDVRYMMSLETVYDESLINKGHKIGR